MMMKSSVWISLVLSMFCLMGRCFCEDTAHSAFHPYPPTSKSQILFLIQSGNLESAIESYLEQLKEGCKHDFELLQELSLAFIQRGFASRNGEDQLLAVFGAGVAMHEKTLPILEAGLENSTPQIQLASLNFLARMQHDDGDLILKRALRSPFVLTRLEAAHFLAQKKDPSALGQIEALMAKVDPQLKPIFPQLVAKIGSKNAGKLLRQMLHDPNEKVRIETLISIATEHRDDLLPQVRLLSSHHHPPQQEACAWCLGELKDSLSIPKLEKLVKSNIVFVRLAAAHSLVKLGKQEYCQKIVDEAKKGDLFAITLLGSHPGNEEVLADLQICGDFTVQMNASAALLERRDSRCLKKLAPIFLRDPRDLAFTKISSPGRTLTAIRIIPSAQENLKDHPFIHELSLGIREALLIKAIELPEQDFLELANFLLSSHQYDLVPSVVALLENLHTPTAIALLQKHQQKLGAPLVRCYCNLALYRMKVPGPYAQNLRDWVTKQQDLDFIKFRPVVPFELREQTTSYQLTPEETSRLLVESFETLADSRDEASLTLLIEALRSGNRRNPYALSGLLMRATQ